MWKTLSSQYLYNPEFTKSCTNLDYCITRLAMIDGVLEVNVLSFKFIYQKLLIKNKHSCRF